VKSISYSSLPELGINPLTGEACAYMMRILCDVNESGVDLLCDYFGIPNYPKAALAANWNSTVGNSPAVASIMLTRSALPEIVRFYFFRKNYEYVVGRDDDINYTAFRTADIERNPALGLYVDRASVFFEGDNPLRLWTNPRTINAVGSRNVHQFTGRTT
jgi:hypothetical protein